MKYAIIFFIVSLLFVNKLVAQNIGVYGTITAQNVAIEKATLSLNSSQDITYTDSLGFYRFNNKKSGIYTLKVSALGYKSQERIIELKDTSSLEINFELIPHESHLNEVVVTGTLKEISRLDSPVPVEVYTPTFFRKNPTPSIFEALQNVNGVRPQLNCNVCNTGDIHINGLEGPYTMILIDGMPIVSGLSTVYGLSGIPNSLVERIEIVKGPASSLYGSEAVGGLINIITKKPQNAPLFSGDFFATSWQELNTDVGFKFNAGKRISVLTGINYFKYGNPIDHNRDNFTDVTQQDRFSIFQKWNIDRKQNRLFTMAGRYNYEDRWGGDISWNKNFRGGTEKYAESIYTNRWELLGNYQMPFKEKLMLAFSYNDHQQNSVYGNVPYLAKQNIAFSQLTWDKTLPNHDLLAGLALRYTYYDDNTPATTIQDINNPDHVWLPGIFVQDEVKLASKHKLLAGIRYDYNSAHGNILTPRLAYKWNINDDNIIRLNAGTGFRVVNLFTEDHAATTGAREVIISEELKPERSYNVNLNYIKKIYLDNGSFLNADFSTWYTHFDNQILPDYETNTNQIIYKNLLGYAISRGMSINLDMVFSNGIKVIAGGSFLDVFSYQENENKVKEKVRPMLTERWAGTWAISYKINPLNIAIDYTGNLYGSMRLPILGDTDPRSRFSPVWSIQNLQFTYSKNQKWEFYSGVKNLLNWVPGKKDPFLIARSHDPFDKNVDYDSNGQVQATPQNSYALTFDPSFVYAPNQGMRGFLGIRMLIRK